MNKNISMIFINEFLLLDRAHRTILCLPISYKDYGNRLVIAWDTQQQCQYACNIYSCASVYKSFIVAKLYLYTEELQWLKHLWDHEN